MKNQCLNMLGENTKILIVEDEVNLRESLIDNLEIECFIAFGAKSVAEAKKLLRSSHFDLIILDIMLPDGDGYSLCKWLRKRFDTRVLMLTARNLEADIVDGFLSGADDYLTKPYRTSELILRIKALLKRSIMTHEKPSVKINDFEIDWSKNLIIGADSSEIHLTKTAIGILNYLYSRRNKTCSREDILDAVWGKDVFVDNRTVDNFISNIKKQLKLHNRNATYIRTVRGIGYCLEIKE